MTHTAHTTGIIDVGGGFRAIFGAGVEDRCLEEDVGFDHCYGISAGSANLASYLARQQGRAHTFYTQYAFRKEYASMENYITKRNFCDLDYVYGTLSNSDGENPLDYAAFSDNPATFTVVAANGEDGSSRYFDKSDMRQDDYTILKASSAVPVACQPVVIDDVPYFDGGIADPIPVQILKRHHPAAAERLLNRYRTYNDEVALARRYEQEGKVLILSPESLYGLSTMSKTFEGLERMYRAGYAQAARIREFLDS